MFSVCFRLDNGDRRDTPPQLYHKGSSIKYKHQRDCWPVAVNTTGTHRAITDPKILNRIRPDYVEVVVSST
jgi:hypothetical protein